MPPKSDPSKGDGGGMGKGADGANHKPKEQSYKKNPNQQGKSHGHSHGPGQGYLKKENKHPQEAKKKYGSQSNLAQQFDGVNIGSSNPHGHGRYHNPNSQPGGSSRPAASMASSGISSDEVKDLLECPVCFEIPKPPIFNCQSGHITCGDCRNKTSCCPLCRLGYSDVRNFIAEKLVESCSFKCFFHNQGCVAMIKGNDEDRHMQLCNFRPLGCEIYPCKGKHIDYQEFLSHLKKEHHAIYGPVNFPKWRREVFVKKPERLMQQGYRVPTIINCYGQTFLQFAQAIGGKMWLWVSLLGTPEEAGRYSATLTIAAKDKDMKSIWMGPVHSVRHSGDDIYFNGLCMVTTEECLKAFFHLHQDGFPCYSIEVAIEKIR